MNCIMKQNFEVKYVLHINTPFAFDSSLKDKNNYTSKNCFYVGNNISKLFRFYSLKKTKAILNIFPNSNIIDLILNFYNKIGGAYI